jgi:hypothetical protein
MTIDYAFLFAGVALLWVPRRWLRRGLGLLRQRRRSAGVEPITDPWKDREPGRPKVNFRAEFTNLRNYVDFLRALAGALAIWGGLKIAPAIAAEAEAPKSVLRQVLMLQGAVVLIGLLIQTVRLEKKRVSFFPPIFFLAGLSVALTDYRAAAFAFLFVWIVNVALGNAQGFLTAYAVLVVVFGGLFQGFASIPVILAGWLTFLPVLLSLLANRPLVVYTHRGSRAPKPT